MAAILVGLFGVLLIAVAVLYRPWSTPAIGYDAASSVLYFDRLAAHQPLEGFVDTTPKPFLTLLYGVAYNLVHDWRLVAILSTIEFPLMLAAAAALAWRTSGPVAAGMTAFGLLGCQRLLLDGALTYANPWAILFWLLAGLALTATSPRYGLAGAALFLAALMRVETFIILAVAAVALAAWRVIPAYWIPGRSRPPARAILLLLGVTALPVMILHDWLLTGDGFFWFDVSSIMSRAVPSAVETPLQLTRDLIQHYAGAWPLALLAAVAVFDLVRRRRLVVLLGLIACGPGVLALLELLAFGHTYVSYRYTIPADAALIFGAGIGADATARALAKIAGQRRPLPERIARMVAGERGRDPLALAAAAVAIGAVAAVAFVSPYGPLDRETWRTINNYRALQAHAERVLPTIAGAVQALPNPPTWTVTDVLQVDTGPPPRLYVPAQLVPRMAVDLGLPVWAIRGGSPVRSQPSILRVAVPTIVYIDVHQGTDAPGDDQPLEVDRVSRVGYVTVEPLLVLPSDGLWVVELRPIGT
ncbi:MAG: hypothetical protein ABSA21_01730 [Candidatus Limnocylindrales bacterium]